MYQFAAIWSYFHFFLIIYSLPCLYFGSPLIHNLLGIEGIRVVSGHFLGCDARVLNWEVIDLVRIHNALLLHRHTATTSSTTASATNGSVHPLILREFSPVAFVAERAKSWLRDRALGYVGGLIHYTCWATLEMVILLPWPCWKHVVFGISSHGTHYGVVELCPVYSILIAIVICTVKGVDRRATTFLIGANKVLVLQTLVTSDIQGLIRGLLVDDFLLASLVTLVHHSIRRHHAIATELGDTTAIVVSLVILTVGNSCWGNGRDTCSLITCSWALVSIIATVSSNCVEVWVYLSCVLDRAQLAEVRRITATRILTGLVQYLLLSGLILATSTSAHVILPLIIINCSKIFGTGNHARPISGPWETSSFSVVSLIRSSLSLGVQAKLLVQGVWLERGDETLLFEIHMVVLLTWTCLIVTHVLSFYSIDILKQVTNHWLPMVLGSSFILYNIERHWSKYLSCVPVVSLATVTVHLITNGLNTCWRPVVRTDTLANQVVLVRWRYILLVVASCIDRLLLLLGQGMGPQL